MVTLLIVSRVLIKTGETQYRGVEQLVARRAHNPKVRGSSPLPATKLAMTADVAQSVERILGKDKVTSSILVISSITVIIRRRSSVG